MPNYTSSLKTWGDVGVEYPDGYSHVFGEPPVDAWDNFFKHNVITDLDHLIGLTNELQPSSVGASFPANPVPGEATYRTDHGGQYVYDNSEADWRKLLHADGDTMEGVLDMGGYQIEDSTGTLSIGSTFDLSGHDIVSGGTTLYDQTNDWVPASRIEQGAGSSLDADTVDGKHAEDLGVVIEEDGAVRVSPATAMNFIGHLNVADDGDGTVTINPSHDHDGRYVNTSGDTMNGGLTVGGRLAVNGDSVGVPVYSSKSDIPTNLPEGSIVYASSDGSLYVEDGN